MRSAIALGCLALLGVQVSGQNLKDGQCAQNFDANTDYFPDKLQTRDDDAQYYEIEYHNNYKLITDHRNEQQYYLVQCGTQPPAGLAANAIIHQVPVTNVAALETTVVPYLEMLGVGDSIHLIADSSMVSSSCFQKYRETSSSVTELSATNVTLANQQADAVQVQFGSSFYITDENGTISSAAVNEPDILGRAAWLGYYAAFYNLESLANEIIADITGNYDRLKQAAGGYKDDQKPLVAWTMYDAPSQYNQNTASWNVSVADFKIQVTEDAGGRILKPDTLQYFKKEDFLQALTDVDIVIDETYIAPTFDALMEDYGTTTGDDSSYKFIKNKRVFRTDGILTPSGGYDWFAAAVVMGDAMLSDMINVVNPSAPSEDYKRIWLRNLAANESISVTTANNCTWDESQPRPNFAPRFEGDGFSMSGASTLTAMGWTAAVLLSTAIMTLF